MGRRASSVELSELSYPYVRPMTYVPTDQRVKVVIACFHDITTACFWSRCGGARRLAGVTTERVPKLSVPKMDRRSTGLGFLLPS